MSMPIKLQQGEEVTLTVKRHPVYAILKLAGSAIVLVVSIYILFVLDPDEGLIGSVLELVAALFGLGAIVALFSFWYRYQNDVWIITNQRLIDSVRQHPFSHKVNTASLRNVQDISIQVDGFIATTFKFGDVLCQTASTDGQFILYGVPEPNRIMDTINANRNKL